jgi:hypothetical protein
MNPKPLLTSRIASRRSGLMDVRSDLLHFALITYALPAERLRPHIPPRFDFPTFPSNGQQLALMSAVPFVDTDFHFYRLAPSLKWQFAQTNYRVYVVDRETGESCVWFFGTTLGSWVVNIARTLWRIPWHYADYDVICNYNLSRRAYDRYEMYHFSEWATAEIEVEDTGQPMSLTPGFSTLDEQILILTHPVTGYFYRERWLSLLKPASVGTYSVWHEEIPFTVGKARNLYFSLYERLGLLSEKEMRKPHSVLICPKTTFEVHLPPKKKLYIHREKQ